MEYMNEILAIVGVLGGGGGIVAVIKQAGFYLKALKQARDTFEEFRTANKTIYAGIQDDPNKQELAKVLSGGVKKIEALTGLDL